MTPLSVNHLALDDLLGAADNAVHRPYPLPLGAPLQILGHALGLRHLPDNEPVAVLRLFVEVCKIAVEPARQDQVIEQERVVFLDRKSVV